MAVADVDEDGIVAAVGERAVEGGRAGVGDQHVAAAGERAGRHGGRPQPGETGRCLARPARRDRPGGEPRRPPRARARSGTRGSSVAGLKPWSCTATAHGVESGPTPSSSERPAEGPAVEIAAAHFQRRESAGSRPVARRRLPRPRCATPRARTRSRSSLKVSAASSVATKAGPARRCAFIAEVEAPPPMSGPLNTTVWPAAVAAAICAPTTCVRDGTTSLTAFSGGSPGCVSRTSAVPAPTSMARSRTPGPCAQRRSATGAGAPARLRHQARRPPAGPRGLKRSFQTFLIASRTMSLVILLCPTLTVDEDDGQLDDAEAELVDPVRHLDLEPVALRVDGIEIDRLEHPAAEALEAAR